MDKETDFEKTCLNIVDTLKGKSYYEVITIIKQVLKILKMRLIVI